jgi:hypothetical protein
VGLIPGDAGWGTSEEPGASWCEWNRTDVAERPDAGLSTFMAGATNVESDLPQTLIVSGILKRERVIHDSASAVRDLSVCIRIIDGPGVWAGIQGERPSRGFASSGCIAHAVAERVSQLD